MLTEGKLFPLNMYLCYRCKWRQFIAIICIVSSLTVKESRDQRISVSPTNKKNIPFHYLLTISAQAQALPDALKAYIYRI